MSPQWLINLINDNIYVQYVHVFRLTQRIDLRCHVRTDLRRKSRTPCSLNDLQKNDRMVIEAAETRVEFGIICPIEIKTLFYFTQSYFDHLYLQVLLSSRS